MDWYRADLHIHSVLSPCGGLEMSADSVMQEAQKKEIAIIAITDHNSMANCAVYKKKALQYNIHFLYGVEIQTNEEIHIVALFNDENEAIEFDRHLYSNLIPIKNNPEFFGDQVVIDEDENIVRFEETALINSVLWSLDETMDNLKKYDTFVFPSHIDDDAFSIIGQLGFIPKHLNFDALGITTKCNLDQLLEKHPELHNSSFIRSSDAHYLNEIGNGHTNFYIEEPSLKEIRFACQKKGDRKIVI